MQNSNYDVAESGGSGFGEWLRSWTLDFHNRTVLFRIGNWIFTTYAFLAAGAFGVGLIVALWHASMAGVDPALIGKTYLFIVAPAVLIGLRSFSIMLEWRELFRRPLATLIKPGYMLHGGIAGAVVSIYAVSEIYGWPLLLLLDGAALSQPMGEAIARLGCYVYGCCWGRPTSSRFGVRYTSKDSKVIRCAPHLHNVKIHPAQLYALVAYLILFFVFVALLPVLPFYGALAGAYCIAHSLIRISLEFFRQDDRGKLWGKLTHTNLYSILMIAGGIAMIVYGSQYSDRTPLDVSHRFIDILGNGSLMGWIAAFGLIFGCAYGVHYRKVGSWIQHPSGGMKPNVDEFSMGAVARMEGSCCDHDDSDHRNH